MKAERLTPGQRARRDDAIAAAYQAGRSAVDVAREVGISATQVLATLVQLGIRRRRRGAPTGPKRGANDPRCMLCGILRVPGTKLCAHHQAIVDRLAAGEREGAA